MYSVEGILRTFWSFPSACPKPTEDFGACSPSFPSPILISIFLAFLQVPKDIVFCLLPLSKNHFSFILRERPDGEREKYAQNPTPLFLPTSCHWRESAVPRIWPEIQGTCFAPLWRHKWRASLLKLLTMGRLRGPHPLCLRKLPPSAGRRIARFL